jgi:glycosyltransferase involved in cell wall biosynthesis
MVTVSVVIRIKNEKKDLVKTIQSIRGQLTDEKIRIEIIVVDNMSIDGGPESVQELVDNIIYIEDKEFSWGRAINYGIKNSSGEYILLMSGHCILTRLDSIINSINIMKRYNLAALYGRQIGDESKDKIECLEIHSMYPILELFTFDKFTKGIGISNAACIMKRSVWERIKFDEALLSAEDAEWCKRIREINEFCGYSSVLEIQHGHYFNANYIYKKWYWRSKTVDELSENGGLKLKATRIFLWLKTILVFMKYMNKKKILVNGISWTSVLKYSYLCELPRYYARKDILNNKSVNKYDDIKIPLLVKKIEDNIIRKEYKVRND